MRTRHVIPALLLCVSLSFAAGFASTTQPSEKLWATDLPAFLSSQSGEWVVGRSSKPALSAEEAESMARADAADAVMTRLQGHLARPTAAHRLRAHVTAAMARQQWIVDRVITSDERPYGTIWSAAVLVDASPDRIAALVRQLERETRTERLRTTAALAGASVILAVVASGYLLLNWLTRGFFRGRLALASVFIATTALIGIARLL